MVSQLNEWMVSEYTDLIRDKEGVLVFDMHGLSVEEAQNLRKSIREAGAEFRLTKKRLAKVAFAEVGLEIGEDVFGFGDLAVLAGDTESTISAAKAIDAAFNKDEAKRITVRGAFLDGSIMNAQEAAGIAGMPDRQTLRGMLCGVLVGPARSLASLLNEVPASTARVVQARADQGDAA